MWCRVDAAAQFAVGLMLDDGLTDVKAFQSFVRRESSHHFFCKQVKGRTAAAGAPKGGTEPSSVVICRALYF